jgi:hypothetical protein
MPSLSARSSMPSCSTMRYMRRALFGRPGMPIAMLVMLVIVSVVLGVVLGGCGASPNANTSATRAASPTATVAPTLVPTVMPTLVPTPPPFRAFTCAAGSLPIGNGYTQIHCSVASEGQYSVLNASYTGQGTNGEVDDPQLVANGWLMIDQAHGDSPNGAIGHALYFNQSAWFAVEYSYPAATMALEQGIPLTGPAAVPCGPTLTAGSSQLQGVPTPSGLVTTRAGAFTFVPACMQDVQRFYTSALPPAGWTLTQPFQAPPGSVAGAPVTTVMATVSRGSTTLQVWLAGGDATPTKIAVGPPV